MGNLTGFGENDVCVFVVLLNEGSMRHFASHDFKATAKAQVGSLTKGEGLVGKDTADDVKRGDPAGFGLLSRSTGATTAAPAGRHSFRCFFLFLFLFPLPLLL